MKILLTARAADFADRLWKEFTLGARTPHSWGGKVKTPLQILVADFLLNQGEVNDLKVASPRFSPGESFAITESDVTDEIQTLGTKWRVQRTENEKDDHYVSRLVDRILEYYEKSVAFRETRHIVKIEIIRAIKRDLQKPRVAFDVTTAIWAAFAERTADESDRQVLDAMAQHLKDICESSARELAKFGTGQLIELAATDLKHEPHPKFVVLGLEERIKTRLTASVQGDLEFPLVAMLSYDPPDNGSRAKRKRDA